MASYVPISVAPFVSFVHYVASCSLTCVLKVCCRVVCTCLVAFVVFSDDEQR